MSATRVDDNVIVVSDDGVVASNSEDEQLNEAEDLDKQQSDKCDSSFNFGLLDDIEATDDTLYDLKPLVVA